MTRYYLDTSAHIERHAGASAERNTIEQLLAGARHSTSTHVRREWKGTVEAAAADVLSAIADSDDLRDVAARCAQGWGRRPGQRWRMLNMLAAGQIDDLDAMDIRARTFIRSQSQILFEHGVDVRDGSECGLAKEEVAEQSDGRFSLRTKCRKAECQCRQADFLEEKRDEVARAADALDSPDARSADRKMGRHAKAVMNASDMLARKGRNCWGPGGLGGDISIALECLPGETLLTTDESFERICPALGLSFRRIAPTPQP